MSTPVFVDTNVLAYPLDRGEPAKQAAACAVLSTESLATSPQVLRELYGMATTKLGIDGLAAAAAAVEALAPLVTPAGDASLVLLANPGAPRWKISVWDALIVEAAWGAGCTQLLSEDLQAGMDFEGVVATNPFAA